MTEVVERLRKSKERFSNEEKVNGHAAGRNWATVRADYEELQRVAAWDASGGYIESPDYQVLLVIAGDKDRAHADYRDFWESESGSATPSTDFVWAFVEGAEEVFNEVADKL